MNIPTDQAPAVTIAKSGRRMYARRPGLPYGVLSEVARRKGVPVTTADYRIFRANDPEYLELALEIVEERREAQERAVDLRRRMAVVVDEAANLPADAFETTDTNAT